MMASRPLLTIIDYTDRTHLTPLLSKIPVWKRRLRENVQTIQDNITEENVRTRDPKCHTRSELQILLVNGVWLICLQQNVKRMKKEERKNILKYSFIRAPVGAVLEADSPALTSVRNYRHAEQEHGATHTNARGNRCTFNATENQSRSMRRRWSRLQMPGISVE